jgi:hypothetical protein
MSPSVHHGIAQPAKVLADLRLSVRERLANATGTVKAGPTTHARQRRGSDGGIPRPSGQFLKARPHRLRRQTECIAIDAMVTSRWVAGTGAAGLTLRFSDDGPL